LKTIKLEKGLEYLKYFRPKIVDKACKSVIKCVATAELCINNGLLPLKMKRFELATSLQNPYIPLIPLNVLANKINNNNEITTELMKNTKNFLGYNKKTYTQLDNLDLYKLSKTSEIPDATSIKMAFNTFKYVFKNTKVLKLKKLEESFNYCRTAVRGSINNLKRKIHFLTISGNSDPFSRYINKLRNKIFAK
jgi:hypothetical protein